MVDLLAGVAVVEAGAGSAVAIAGSLLADAGASVVKIAPQLDERTPAWKAALDYRKTVLAPPDALLAGRVANARIVLLGDPDPSSAALESLAPRRGLTVARAGAIPGVREPVDDLLVQAAGGICAGIGEAKRAPLKLPLDQSAQQAGLVLALAACATLFGDEGARIDVTALEVWAAFYAGPGVAAARFGRSKTRRAGHRTLGVPWPRTLLRCKDGYFAVQCATRDQWRRFLSLVGKPELETAPLFADRIAANDNHGDEAEAVFADWFGARTKDELARAFIEAKIAGAPVYAIDEVARSSHLETRGTFANDSASAPGGAVANLPFILHDGPSAQPRSTGTAGAADAPLAGIRVLDFGWVWAGAVPGHVLADLGAEVIKVETATHLDYMRQGRPIVGKERDPEQNPMFVATNRGKLSLRIDMTKPEGAQILRNLAARCDVAIENFAPGVLDRHGLGYKQLSAARPDLVMCSMSAAGATGDLREIRTYATMIAGLCGLDSMVGYPGERVLGSQSSYCDPNGSLHAAFAVLAALYRRKKTGRGCWIDLSQWEAGVRAVGEALAAWSSDGSVPGPTGLKRADRLVHGTFPTAGDDEWIALSIRDADDWSALRTALGDPAWMAAADRAASAKVAGETGRFSADQLVAKLGPARAAKVVSQDDLGDEPGIEKLDLFEEVAHTILDPIPVYRLPWRQDGKRFPIRRRAPKLGEHNAYVLHELLGLSEERIAELEAAEVLI